MQDAAARVGRGLSVGLCVLVAAGASTSSAQGLAVSTTIATSSTVPGDLCSLDRVVVDPDGAVATLLPGCETPLDVQVFGSGGTFDLFVEDDAGGGGYYDIVGVVDGERLSVPYTPPYVLPDNVTVAVYLDPHSIPYVCSEYSHGTGGEKRFLTPTPQGDCQVSVRVDEEIDVGELRVRVGYPASAGGIPGCARGAVCTSQAFRLMVADDDAGSLDVVAASPVGHATPAEILRCAFAVAAGSPEPSAQDFDVTVTEAGGPPPARDPIEPPAVSVHVECPPPSTTTTTLPEVAAVCGRPCTHDDGEPGVRDALYVLQASVGSAPCKTCICDVDRSGTVTSSDALAVLGRAVGLDRTVRCVVCAAPLASFCP